VQTVSGDDNKRDDSTSSGFSLESILAEYKGSAFINGDKRTPPGLLKEQAEKIVEEAIGKVAADPPHPDSNVFDEDFPDFWEDAEETGRMDMTDEMDTRLHETAPTDEFDEFTSAPDIYQDEQNVDFEHLFDTQQGDAADAIPNDPKSEETDHVVMFFDNYRSPSPEPEDSIIREVEKAVEWESRDIGEPIETGKWDFNQMERPLLEEQDVGMEEEDLLEEPDLGIAAKSFARECNSISLRCIPAALVSVIMVILTFAYEAEMILPFGIGRSMSHASGALLIAMLVVMMLCVDIIMRGALNLLRGAPNVESLLLFSCVFSFIAAVISVFGGTPGVLPYCAVSAISLTFAAFGEKFNLRAITETLKTAVGSAEPYGVQAEYNGEIDKSVLKKAYNRTDGFYSNLLHPDIVETTYRYATPILLAAALVLSAFTALLRGQGANFFHMLSALLAASAPFSALLTFSVPFSSISKTTKKSGAAIAGWGGADDVCFTDGACVTDDDLFPPGTLTINGMKLYEGVPPEKAMRYTASLIIASGSGLSRVFSDVLKSQGMSVTKVEDFACYEGGIGGLLRGEQVATGSAAFMNLLGIRVPDDMNMKNAVYTSINNKLVAVFSVDYTPINSVQSALISILKWRIKLFFAVRDFNVTPVMLEQKFRVSLEDIEFIQARESYSISDLNSGKRGRMAAVLTREGLGPFAEAVTGGRLLKSAALAATIVSLISAAIGVIIMVFLCWS